MAIYSGFTWNMVIFHSYISLPEGTIPQHLLIVYKDLYYLLQIGEYGLAPFGNPYQCSDAHLQMSCKSWKPILT